MRPGSRSRKPSSAATRSGRGAALRGLVGDGAHALPSLAGRLGGRARARGVCVAAPAGPEVVSVGAERRAGTADPHGAGEDQRGADVPNRLDRPAPVDELEGPAPARMLAAAAQSATAEHPAV